MILLILLLVTCIPLGMYFLGDSNVVPGGGQAEIGELTIPDEDPIISEDEAMGIVLDMLPGSSYGDLLGVSQTYYEGGWIYEGAVRGKDVSYEYQVDGENGNILKWIVAKKK